MSSQDILVFVEDPGAANYVLQLPSHQASSGYRMNLFADGHAVPYLAAHQVEATQVEAGVTAKSLLSKYHPRLVVVGTSENPQTLGLKLIAEARERKLESVGIVDALANSAFRFRGGTDDPLAFSPDWLLVPDAATAATYMALGYPSSRLLVCGHPHYDHVMHLREQWDDGYRRTLREDVFPGVASHQRVVVFATELSVGLNSSQFLRSEEYTLMGRGERHTRTEIVLEEFLDAISLLRPQPYLVLRLHPKNTPDDFSDFLGAFHHVSQGGSPLPLLFAADFVVGMTSSLLAEATLLGRQTLSIIPRACESQWLPLGDLIPSVTSRSALQGVLRTWADTSLSTFSAPVLEASMPTNSLQTISRFLISRLSSQPC
ncbi:hypothetical protein D3C72_59380 [compost metagenome]